MIDTQELSEWLSARIKDESEALNLLESPLTVRAMTFGAREAYLSVLSYIQENDDD